MSYKTPHDSHFRLFASSLESNIARCNEGQDMDQDFTARQKAQVERLVKLETEFRRALIKHPWGPSVYRDFIRLICDEKRNILAARPYFRERQTVFTSKISKALKRREDKALYKFHFNYQFILFVMKSRKWHKTNVGFRICQLYKEITDARTELVVVNAPLAISRARIFGSRTQESHLAHMDLVQITAEGLMSGVDKFVLPYTTGFRAVLIGRMIGNLIEQYSETMIHFYPADKRKLYRANKAMPRGADPVVDYGKITERVNDGVEDNQKTNPDEVASLLAAASIVSSDTPICNEVGQESMETLASTFVADESYNPELQMQQREALSVMGEAITHLSLIERKLLRLKGVEN